MGFSAIFEAEGRDKTTVQACTLQRIFSMMPHDTAQEVFTELQDTEPETIDKFLELRPNECDRGLTALASSMIRDHIPAERCNGKVTRTGACLETVDDVMSGFEENLLEALTHHAPGIAQMLKHSEPARR